MDRTTKFGLYAALVTPFDEAGAPDLARTAAHARSVVEGGCDGVTLFGTTGEGYGISPSERRDMLRAVVAALPSGTPICVGIMSCAIDTAADLARAAYAEGASKLLLAPPFFMKNMDDDGLFAWFSAVFDRIGAPLAGAILYHIPGQTAAPVSVDLVSRLRAAFPGVVTGIKDSSGDRDSTRAFLAAHGDISILVGDERQLPDAMANGAEGSICGVANFLPGLLREIVHGGSDGRVVSEIVDHAVAYPIIPAIKALTAHATGDAGFLAVRPPLSPLAEAARKSLVAQYEAAMAPA